MPKLNSSLPLVATQTPGELARAAGREGDRNSPRTARHPTVSGPQTTWILFAGIPSSGNFIYRSYLAWDLIVQELLSPRVGAG